jgi:hypothetical protein
LLVQFPKDGSWKGYAALTLKVRLAAKLYFRRVI